MITVQVTGVNEAIENLKLSEDDVRQSMEEVGLLIEADMKRLCTQMGAVDTGRLRASMSTALDGTSQRDEDSVIPPKKDMMCFAVLRAGSNVDYAPYVVFGTRTMQGRDFITPAVMNNVKKIEPLIKAKMED